MSCFFFKISIYDHICFVNWIIVDVQYSVGFRYNKGIQQLYALLNAHHNKYSYQLSSYKDTTVL